jgi:hypothetical protein
VSSPEPRRSSKNLRRSFGVNPRTIVISPSTTCVTFPPPRAFRSGL